MPLDFWRISEYYMIMADKKSIGEIADVSVGLNIKNYKDEFSSSFTRTDSDAKIISISNIDSSGFLIGDFQKIKDVGDRISNYKVIEGDVIINSRGTAIKSAVVDSERDGYIINSNIIAIRIKQEYRKFISPEMLEMCIRQGDAANEVKKSSKGSAILVLTKELLKNVKVPIMEEERQENFTKLIVLYREINMEVNESREFLESLSANIINLMNEK